MRGTKTFSFDEVVFHRIEDLSTEQDINQTALLARLVNAEWDKNHPPLVEAVSTNTSETAAPSKQS